MKKVLSIILIFTFVCSSLCGCTQKENPSPKLEKFSDVIFDAFDTAITITAYCKDKSDFDALFNFAKEEFAKYHRLYDIYHSYDGITNIKDLNDIACDAPASVDSEIIELLSYAKEMYVQTNGRINIAMGSVLRLWHNAREMSTIDRLPEEDMLKGAAEHCNIDDLIIDNTAKIVFFNDKDLKLDVGAVAKGFATEKIKEKLIEKGYDHFLINAGGNVSTYGTKPDGSSWTIGIQNPDTKSKESYIKTVSIETNSVVTSGVYERNFVYEGKLYHHIIDPDTLMPENRFLSVSIITKSSAAADALSTAVFNMELQQGQEFINSLVGVEAMWILNDNTQVFSDGFEQYTN